MFKELFMTEASKKISDEDIKKIQGDMKSYVQNMIKEIEPGQEKNITTTKSGWEITIPTPNNGTPVELVVYYSNGKVKPYNIMLTVGSEDQIKKVKTAQELPKAFAAAWKKLKNWK